MKEKRKQEKVVVFKAEIIKKENVQVVVSASIEVGA